MASSNIENVVEMIDNDESKQMLTEESNAIWTISDLESADNVVCEDQINYGDADVKEDDSVAIYSCSSCNVKFLSVLEHIQEFHSNQEVVVEMEEDAALDNSQMEEVTLLQVLEGNESVSQEEIQEGIVMEEDGVPADNHNAQEETITNVAENGNVKFESSVSKTEPVPVVETSKRSNTRNWKTLCEQQCVDSDGRVYTRKVVQIERFWEPKEESIKTEYAKNEVEESSDDIKEEVIQLQENDKDPLMSRVYHCIRCSTQYNSFEEFDLHACVPTGKVPVSKYKCEHCEAIYVNSKSLCAHMKVHKGIKKKTPPRKATDNSNGTYKCEICDTSFPTNKSLRLHSRMHDPIKKKPIEAPVEYKSSSKRAVSDDPLGASANNTDKFHCQLCDKWMHIGYKKVHEMTFHAGLDQYNCEICNRKFFTEENLEMHLTVHNNEKVVVNKSEHPLPYECNYCSRQFSRPHEKVKHERIHTGERPHVCEICGKSFRVSYCLTLHMRTHTGARPYECSHCGKRFKAHSVYNHHVLTHSNVRNYQCPYCTKSFKTSVQLAGHKNAHTKPFSCTECNRPFASLYAVRVHMETHKRQNNLKFNCAVCGASYARAFALKDHVKSQHSNDSSETDMVQQKEFHIPEVAAATLSIIPEDDKVVDIVIENVNEEDMEVWAK